MTLMASVSLGAQATGTVTGRVFDASTGLPRSNVSVTVLPDGRAAMADAAGRYVLERVVAGQATLRVRVIGYTLFTRSIDVSAGDTTVADVPLTPNPVTLRTIRVGAAPTEHDEFTALPNVGAVTLSTRAVQAVPRLGEADVVRAVQLAPGIEARNDYSTGFTVHGGESDQNLILIDHYPIYNPFHLGGLFSTFIGSTVRDVQLLTGSIPAQYGGRLSSVMDVRSAEEPREGIHGGAELSVLAATASAGGAFANQRGSWMIAGRRTYADQLSEMVSNSRLPYHFRDEQGHFSYQLTPTVDVAFTIYDGRDVLDGSFSQVGDSSQHDAGGGSFFMAWGNLVAGGTLAKTFGRTVLGDSGRIEQRVSSSRFATRLDLGSGSLDTRSSLGDAKVSGLFTDFTSHGSRTAGYDLDRFDVRYSTLAGRASVDPVASAQQPTTVALFYDELWRASSRLLLDGGLRGEGMTGRSYRTLSPRLSAKFFTSETSALTAAVGHYTQWIHSTTLEDDPILLFDYWHASDSVTPVSSSWQYMLGNERWLSTTRSLKVEAFYKRFANLLEGNPEQDPSNPSDDFVSARGASYGIDATIRQYEVGPLSGWITYTYTFNWRQHDSVRYAPAQDRRNNVNAVAAWRLGGYQMSARIGYGSGIPYTAAVGSAPRRYYDPVLNSWGTGGDRATLDNVGGARNGARLPPTHRIDLQLQRSFQVRGVTVSPYASIVNVTNAHNVLFYAYDFSRSPATRLTVGQFPLLPSAGASIVF